MIAIAATIAAAVGLGFVAERRWGERAQGAARATLTTMLYTLVPFIVFFNLARLEITVEVGAGIGLAYAAIAAVGTLAWLLGSRGLGLARPATGALIVGSIQANTGYLGLPLTLALLGGDEVSVAVAYDTLVAIPVLFVGAFAVGAAFGSSAGETRRERGTAFLLRNPPLLAAAAGLLAPDALAPDVLVDASRALVAALLPLGFFAVGVTLAAEAEEGALPIPPPLTRPVVAVMALRMLVAPALLALLALPLIDLPEPYLLLAAMPCGINGLVVAHAYGLDLRLTASAIAWSTIVVVLGGLLAVALA